MKLNSAACFLVFSATLSFLFSPQLGAAESPSPEMQVIRPGHPGSQPFWNTHAGRFIYPPAFEFNAVQGAANYRFVAKADGKEHSFTSSHPWDPLTPIWAELPEGFVELTVSGLDADGKIVGKAGERGFYRSPGFSAKLPTQPLSYLEAGRLGLRALFVADHVQHWIKKGGPDRSYDFYCYPAKIQGALILAMVAYSEFNAKSGEAKQALLIARKAADHLIKASMPRGTPFEFWPPTYSVDVNKPKGAASTALASRWMMTHYPCDAAFGYLDLYKQTKDKEYLQAAVRIADTYARTQAEDGTWPLVVDFETGEEEAPNRLVPTWVIFLFDRLDREHGFKNYVKNRQRAWEYIERGPLRTFAWDAQFEDTKPRPPYRNLAREQSCDVATIIFENPKRTPTQVEIAKELLRFGEDQFVVWSEVKDPAGWRKARLERGLKTGIWIPPLVLEQYTCYMPVARSSAVFIKAYLAAYQATGEAVYIQKARALGNSLIEGQQDQIKNYGGKGEIPTWVVRNEPKNWLNNSFYAAESLVALARAEADVQTAAR